MMAEKEKILTCKATGSTLKPKIKKCREEPQRTKLGSVVVEESGYLVITDPDNLPEVDEQLFGELSKTLEVGLGTQLTFNEPKFPRERAGLGILLESGEGVFDVYAVIKNIKGEEKITKIEMILVDGGEEEYLPKKKELPKSPKYPPCPPCPPR